LGEIKNLKEMVYLITGKTGAGKSTYAERLLDELSEEGQNVKWLDGNAWRKEHNNQDFSDKGRYKNLMSAARKAQEYEQQGYVVILSFVAPKKSWRMEMRSHWQRSYLVHIPGGTLWEGTTYERPDLDELVSICSGIEPNDNSLNLQRLV